MVCLSRTRLPNDGCEMVSKLDFLDNPLHSIDAAS
jgi:hypothetical protein